MVSGSSQQIDNLGYSYNGNQLTSVSDGSGGNYTALGFKNLTGSSSMYSYDTNGNLSLDPYKGIISGYNILNKVEQVTINTSSGRYINYTFDAGGILIRKQQYDGGANY